MAHAPLTREEEWRYAREALTWYGWGSPVGLGFGIVCLGLAAILFRIAVIWF